MVIILTKAMKLMLIPMLLSSAILATPINTDEDVAKFMTRQQLTHDTKKIINFNNFDPHINYHIFSYLGRCEVGRIQQANKHIHELLNKQESVSLWTSYVKRLQLELSEDTEFGQKVDYLIDQIKNYYQPHVDYLFNENDIKQAFPCTCITMHSFDHNENEANFSASYTPLLTNMRIGAILGTWDKGKVTIKESLETFVKKPHIGMSVSAEGKEIKWYVSSDDRKTMAGESIEGYGHKPFVKRNGTIKELDLFDQGERSIINTISSDGSIIGGQRFRILSKSNIATIWVETKIISFGDYIKGNILQKIESDLKRVITISKNGSNFYIESNSDDVLRYYKVHRPRDDLWNMAKTSVDR